MATGDQDEQDQTEPDGAPGFVEIEPVRCSCEWATMDTGLNFYSRIVKPDPRCPAHRR